MKPICVRCQRFYRMKRGGHAFTEMMPRPGHERARPGLAEPDSWTPYKLWFGDLWHCPDCGNEIVVGTGRAPVSEHYHDDFADKVAGLRGNQLQVKDC